jgi:hypothetical protein
MEISAAISPAASFQQQPVQRQQEPLQPAERPRENTETPTPARTRETQPPPPPPEARSAENPERAARPEAPKPVINAQGQKTGTIINTTA